MSRKKAHSIIIIGIFLLFTLVADIFLFSDNEALADELWGQGFFVEQCVGCHEIKAPLEGESIALVLQKKAPSLRYAGSKFNKAFLVSWLQEPLPIRPLKYNTLTEKNPSNHKKLSPKEAANVVNYLMTLRSTDIEPLNIKAKESILAKKIFSVRYSCYSCHQVRGQGSSGVTGGLSGPSLVEAGIRLNPDWIYAFLSSPRDLLPKGSMPVYAGIISDEDLKELTKYIATFK